MTNKQLICNIILIIPLTLVNLIGHGIVGVKEMYEFLYKETRQRIKKDKIVNALYKILIFVVIFSITVLPLVVFVFFMN